MSTLFFTLYILTQDKTSHRKVGASQKAYLTTKSSLKRLAQVAYRTTWTKLAQTGAGIRNISG